MTAERSSNPPDPVHDTPAGGVADYDPRRPVFAVPYRQLADQFRGREAALDEVRQQLDAGRRTCITQAAGGHDQGGLGKTQVAVEYAYRYL